MCMQFAQKENLQEDKGRRISRTKGSNFKEEEGRRGAGQKEVSMLENEVNLRDYYTKTS
jgi:hypothetical protein